jgi:hypothetical protein
LTFLNGLGFAKAAQGSVTGAWGVTVPGFDLYEFPEGYIGRKTYVTVQGHSKSIPALYTYKGTDGRNHVLPEHGGTDEYFARASGPMIMRGMTAFVSPIDGTVIHSRTGLSDHEKRHNVIQVGNEKFPPRTDAAPMPRAGHDIKRALETARSK